jgi:hypothetical protein
MHKPNLFAVILGTVAAFSVVMPAQARINQRQAHQQHRITSGISHGTLTAHEAVRLERQQVHIARYEAHSRRDGGGLSARERARIEQLQDHASHSIYRQKHDRQGR